MIPPDGSPIGGRSGGIIMEDQTVKPVRSLDAIRRSLLSDHLKPFSDVYRCGAGNSLIRPWRSIPSTRWLPHEEMAMGPLPYRQLQSAECISRFRSAAAGRAEFDLYGSR